MGQGRTTGAWSYPQLWHMVILMAFALTRPSPLFTAKTHLSDLLAMTDCPLRHYSYLTHSLFLLRRATAHEDCGTKYPWVGSEGLIKWHHEVTCKELPPWWTGINSAVCLLRWDLCAYPLRRAPPMKMRKQPLSLFLPTHFTIVSWGTSMFLRGFLYGSDGKESACKAGDEGSIPGSGRSPGEGIGNPLQYSCLKNSRDRGAWQAAAHGVIKRWIRLSN